MRNHYKQLKELWATLNSLRPHMRGGRFLLLALIATSLGAALLEGIGVGMLVPMLSLMLGDDQAATPMRPISWMQTYYPNQSQSFYVAMFCLAIFCSILAKNLILYFSKALSAKLRTRISVNLRESLFTTLHKASIQVFEQHTPGELSNLFLTETARTVGLFEHLINFIQRILIAFFYIGLLFFISIRLTFFTILLALAIGMAVRFLFVSLKVSGQLLSKCNRQLSSCVLESFAGIRLVRATNAQAHEYQKFQNFNRQQAQVEEDALRQNALVLPLAESIAVLGGMLIVGFSYTTFVKSGDMLPSYLLAFGFILVRLLPLINQTYGMQGHILYLAHGAKKVEEWLQTIQYPVRPFGSKELTNVCHWIAFREVSYAYPDGTQALVDINFTIPVGTTVALVGSSGSGKSTIANLLLRIRIPTAGAIEVDETDYKEFSPESWHEQIASVDQDTFIFNDTLWQNIGYGFPAVSDAQVEQAIDIANLRDLVNSLPDGLSTVLGERGTRLSGGQRQRLAIARAIVRNPKVLILDEATSSLDNISESQVQLALNAALKSRTVLIIAHRLSTIQTADQILVMNQGRIVETGSYNFLSRKNGNFSEMIKAGNKL